MQQAGGGFDQILITDISRALSSVLDQTALYGDGLDQPLGIANTPGTVRLPWVTADPIWPQIVAAETAVATANVSMDSYGNICSPAVRGVFRTTGTLGAQGELIRHKMINPFASTQCTTDQLFFGSFGLMVLELFGESVDLIIDTFTRGTTAQTVITANMFADVGLRLPAAFGLTTDPIPVVRTEPAAAKGGKK